ncbi:hypothetical protein FIU87_19685 [Bacillus sp. THAF10]|uniref:hypothetical protein n=1 Tax=Bacillus sp. THAF10 TaxID=2587848 RepID=UPI0012680FB7|nr:hypothetical protein [Bacillus sp. THAF10]QFT90872.1 hypothetical protein FIU87_19685 [Bacillus sp. THAF10]
MKKVIISCLLVGFIGIGSYFVNMDTKNDIAEAQLNTDYVVDKIESFALKEEDQVKVSSLEKEVSFGKDKKIFLFTQDSNKLGYAIFDGSKLVLVASGDGKQEYDQYGNFFIVYGEKPDMDARELHILINRGPNHEDITETFELDEEKYYLVIKELPKGIKQTKVFSDNYNFK